MENILLSINIPTFNRSGYLNKLLLSIFSNLNDSNAEIIEINIIDNASEDDTKSIVDKYIYRGNIKYQCNECNIGPMKNIHLAHRVGIGKYVWVFGDDDYIVDGKLPYILDCLKKDPDVALLSYERKTPDNILVGYVSSGDKDLFFDKNSPNFSLKIVDNLIGFLTANIVKRQWINLISEHEYEELDARGELAHAAIIYRAIGAQGKIYYLSDVAIVQTADNGYLQYFYWKKVCFDYCNKLPELLVSFGFNKNDTTSFFKDRLIKECFKRLLSDKYRGKDHSLLVNDADIRCFLKYFYHSFYLLSLVPGFIIRVLYNFCFEKRM